MSKKIIIIGGGISGLSLLHFLKKQHENNPEVSIQLLEREEYLGGTIKTIHQNSCLFEMGPNGFLDSKPRTLQLINELGLSERVVKAGPRAKKRYVCVANALKTLPTTPFDFLMTPLLSVPEKFRVFGEAFVKKGNHPQESVYGFGKRRFGKRVAEIFFDPMVTGIYGGDVCQLNLKEAFPKIYDLEDQYGSLIKAMRNFKKEKKPAGKAFGGNLTSFKNGMVELILAIREKYQDAILLNQEIKTIVFENNQFEINSGEKKYKADEIYLCVPAYSAAKILRGVHQPLCDELEKINYAPMAVVGLAYSAKIFKQRPTGFGYLIPSQERKKALGVLFEHDIFPGRCPADQVLLRVMIGGSHNPKVVLDSEETIKQIAVNEIKDRFGVQDEPSTIFFARWSKAIPQYDQTYAQAKERIESYLKQWPALHLVSNYWHGVSFNDCIENAYQSAQ